MDAWTESELAHLRHHWGLAYDIGHDEAVGTWTARYLGSTDRLTSPASDELRQQIRADYQRRRQEDQRYLAGLQERSSI